MHTKGLARSVVAQAALIVTVIITGVIVAVVKPDPSSASPTRADATKLGTALCYGFGQASVSQYRAAARLPDVESDIKTLSRSSDWSTVSIALTQLAALGAPTAWSTTQRTEARKDLAALHAACVPHLPS